LTLSSLPQKVHKFNNVPYFHRVLANVIVSSGTNLAAGMPDAAKVAFQKDPIGAMGALLAGAFSAKSKREKPELPELMRANFAVEDNFPRHTCLAAITDPGGAFNWNISDELKNIRKPTLVLAGEDDQSTPVVVNKFLADHIPGAQLRVIKDVGHFCQLESPAMFNHELAQFVKQVTA
jgi:pimeloyl-ACP methyl ester carboxylesterase